MKKKYLGLEFEVIEFIGNDVIMTNGPVDPASEEPECENQFDYIG